MALVIHSSMRKLLGLFELFSFRFGVSISNQPIEVDAIRRERPKIVYSSRGNQRSVTTHKENVFLFVSVILNSGQLENGYD